MVGIQAMLWLWQYGSKVEILYLGDGRKLWMDSEVAM